MTARDWHWEDIKSEIRKRETTLTGLALRHGFSSSAVHVLKFASIPRVQATVAELLGVKPQEIWPSRYDEAGRPKRRRRSDAGQRRPDNRACARQKQETL